MSQENISLELCDKDMEGRARALAAKQARSALMLGMAALANDGMRPEAKAMILGRAMNLANEPLPMAMLRVQYCRGLLNSGCENPELVAKSLGTATARCVQLTGGCLRCALAEVMEGLPLTEELMQVVNDAAAMKAGIKDLGSSGGMN